jgi:hypothetical protein
MQRLVVVTQHREYQNRRIPRHDVRGRPGLSSVGDDRCRAKRGVNSLAGHATGGLQGRQEEYLPQAQTSLRAGRALQFGAEELAAPLQQETGRLAHPWLRLGRAGLVVPIIR